MNSTSNIGEKLVPIKVSAIKETKTFKLADSFWSIIWLIVLVLLGFRIFVYQQVSVQGASMQPNYQDRDMLLINQVDRNFKRGQVVAVYEDKEIAKNANYFTRFDPKTVFFLKRVIALPGEEIEMVGSKVIVYNSEFPKGAVINEEYVATNIKDSEDLTKFYFPKTKIQSDMYFLLGDNRTNSTDSRKKGAFPVYSLFGQENIKYWPLGKASTFTLPSYTYSNLTSENLQKIEEYKENYLLQPKF